jgi:alkylation response protein AidB-like acyl-CoA dehydrogenase
VDGFCQEVWNTFAHIAERGMLVARTDPDVPKHKGLTYIALDLHSPAVEVRPLRQMTGDAEFNAVYLNEVRVSDSDRIGEIGEGWRVAMTPLMSERTTIRGAAGGPERGSGAIAEAVRIWRDEALDRHPEKRDRLMRPWCEPRYCALPTSGRNMLAERVNPDRKDPSPS